MMVKTDRKNIHPKNIQASLRGVKAQKQDARKKDGRPRVFIATGASGGHIFPALAIADVLRREGYWCTFVGTAKQFAPAIKAQGFDIISLPSAQVNVPGVRRKLMALKSISMAFLRAAKLIHSHKPVAILGMGSYASVSTVLAGRALRVPTLIHEQNARPGRANRFLSRFVSRILLAYDAARRHFPQGLSKPEKFHVVGNPVRKDVLDLRGVERESSKTLNLLIVGGSQGARILTDTLPDALYLLPKKLRGRIAVTQQARPEDVDRLTAAYQDLGMGSVQVSHFFDDLPLLMHNAHVVVSRAGTGTISELAVLNRAAILVPIRLADGHQVDNAKILSKINAATLMEEQTLTPEALAAELETLLTRDGKRAMYEKNTTLVAKPQAAKDAAAAVMAMCGGDSEKIPAEEEDDTEIDATDQEVMVDGDGEAENEFEK